jgi:Mrp family chromosome partitioning ATPase
MQDKPECSSCAENTGGECGKDSDCGIDKLRENFSSRIKNVVAVMSGKGGVGKSSITSLLACHFREKGYKVGVLDADITGPSVPKMFGVRGMAASDGVAILPPVTSTGIKIMSLNLLMDKEDDPVIWRGPIIAGAVKQFWTDVAWGELDYLIVDLPPGTGDVPLTVMQSLPLNGLMIVTSPQDLATLIVTKAIKMARQMNVPIMGLVENMSSAICPHCGEEISLFGRGQGKEMAKSFGIPFIGSLPLDPVLSRLCDEGGIEKYSHTLFRGFDPMSRPQ